MAAPCILAIYHTILPGLPGMTVYQREGDGTVWPVLQASQTQIHGPTIVAATLFVVGSTLFWKSCPWKETTKAWILLAAAATLLLPVASFFMALVLPFY